jgi:hypothetical protein
MVELKGSLDGFGLPAIVQLIGELQRSGTLELSAGGRRGVLAFDEGRLVAADFAQEHGFVALAALSRELAGGEFAFHEGTPANVRTLDIAPQDLQAYFSRIVSGEELPAAALATPVENVGPVTLGTCPLLGFADDRTTHYSRPTLLHRCFATGAPSLVDGPQQRDLCLSDRYPACPRYRAAPPGGVQETLSGAPQATSAGVRPGLPLVPPLAPATPAAAVPAQPTVVPPAAASPPEPDSIPAGPISLPARVEAARKKRQADRSPRAPASGRAAVDSPGPRGHPGTRPPLLSGLSALPRRSVWIGAGTAVGLGLALMVLFVVLPALGNRLAAPNPTVAGVQTSPTAATSTGVPALAAPPAQTPTLATLPAAQGAAPDSSPAAVALPATPSSAASGSAVAPGGQPMLDVRFVSGQAPGWLDHPPFVRWADGAYRLEARQAARFVALGAPIDKQLSNVVVSATLRKTGGPPGGGYGLVVRDQGPVPRDGANQTMSAYVFEAGDLGQFGVWRRDGDHWVDLVSWTPSVSVRPGGSPNDLSVRAIGTRFRFTINGNEVASVDDGVLTAGGVGVFVGGDFNEVALDHFTVEVPD